MHTDITYIEFEFEYVTMHIILTIRTLSYFSLQYCTCQSGFNNISIYYLNRERCTYIEQLNN